MSGSIASMSAAMALFSRFPLERRRYHDRQLAQIEVIGLETARPLSTGAFDLGQLNLRGDDSHDSFGDLVLEVEDVGQRAVEVLRPEVRAGRAHLQVAR